MVKDLIHMSAWTYIREVFVRVLVVGLLSLPMPLIIYFIQEDSVWRFLEIGTTSVICTIASVLLFGMKADERQMVFGYLRKKLQRE